MKIATNIYKIITLSFSILFVISIVFAVENNSNEEIIPVSISDNGKYVLITNASHQGLILINTESGQSQNVTDTINAGYYATISPNNKYICFKGFQVKNEHLLQAPMLFNIKSDELIQLSEWNSLTGTPTVSGDGKIAYTSGNELTILNPDLSKLSSINVENHINLLAFSFDGSKIAYCDDIGNIIILSIMQKETTITKKISTNFTPCFLPKFSPEGDKILVSSITGEIIFINIDNGEMTNFGKGQSASWLNNSTIAFLRKEIEDFEVKKSEIIIAETFNKELKPISSFEGNIEASVSPQNIIISQRENLLNASYEKDKLKIEYEIPTSSLKTIMKEWRSLESKTEYVVDDGTTVELIGVPVIHQVYDTPDSFNGNAACGATAAMQAIQYYNILPAHPITCSWPYSHTSNYGWYVSNIYSYNGYTYDIYTNDPSFNPAYGGYGYICQDTGWYGTPARGSEHTSIWLSRYIDNHGPDSSRDTSPTWAEAQVEINNDNPFVLLSLITASGHYTTCIGYFKAQYTLIFNDPYGNKNTPGYPSYDGERVFYDWPGYNNGYENLNTVSLYVLCRYDSGLLFRNALQNGGFEDDFNYWSTGASTTADILTSGAHRGNKACQFYRTGGGYATIWQNPYEVNGETWRTTCYAYYITGMTLTEFGFKDQSGITEASTPIDSTSWKFCSVDWTIADDIDSQAWGTGSQGVVIDDVRAGKASKMNWITDWIWNGTYGSNINTDYFAADGAETNIKPSPGAENGGNTWTTVSRGDGFIDLQNEIGGSPTNCVTYAHIYVIADSTKNNINLVVGSNDGIKVFLNGSAIHTNDITRAQDYFYPDQDAIEGITLNSGENRLMIKVKNVTGLYTFSARFCDNSGNAISGLTYSLSTTVAVDKWQLY